MGDRLRADHGYRLYSALVERIPGLKDCEWQLKTVNGIPDGRGWIKLGRESHLGVRCDLALLEAFGALDNQILRVGQNLLQLGTLEGQSLEHKPFLSARLVTIKSKFRCRVSEFEFGVALGKQLQIAGIEPMPMIGSRKSLKIKDTAVTGYAVTLAGLQPHESLYLQRYGIGGRRKMGCGVFE